MITLKEAIANRIKETRKAREAEELRQREELLAIARAEQAFADKARKILEEQNGFLLDGIEISAQLVYNYQYNLTFDIPDIPTGHRVVSNSTIADMAGVEANFKNAAWDALHFTEDGDCDRRNRLADILSAIIYAKYGQDGVKELEQI